MIAAIFVPLPEPALISSDWSPHKSIEWCWSKSVKGVDVGMSVVAAEGGKGVMI
jgi:hypothetical protein